MTNFTQPSEAAAYARISLDKEGSGLGVARQLAEIRQWAKERNITITRELVDNDISATTGKTRPNFEALLAGDDRAVIVWHQDRLLRVSKDLERVLDAEMTVHQVQAGSLELDTPSGRAIARTITAWSSYEGEMRSARQRSRNSQAAENGQYLGTYRPFGHEKNGQPREDEAQAIREAAKKLVTGETTFYSIAKAWNKQGLKTAVNGTHGGNAWRSATVNQFFASPRLYGYQEYKGTLYKLKDWTPLLSKEDFDTIQTLRRFKRTGQKGKTTTRGNAHPLTGIAHCGICDSPVTIYYTGGKQGDPRKYSCRQPQHMRVSAKALEDAVYIEAFVLLSEVDDSAEKEDYTNKSKALTQLIVERGEEVESFNAWRVQALKSRLAPADIEVAQQAHKETLSELDQQILTLRQELNSGFGLLLGDKPVSLIDQVQRWATGIEAMTDEARRELLTSLFESVQVAKIGRGKRLTPNEHITYHYTPYGAQLRERAEQHTISEDNAL